MATKAAKNLGRAISQQYGYYQYRNWLQVKYADSIYAVAAILEPNEKDKKGYVNKSGKQVVEGGTGYAVEMAIMVNKPVYVFDQLKNKWFTWKYSTTDLFGDSSGGSFIETDTPVLTKNFASIGTREINPNGRQAITDVYTKTFNNPVVEKSTDEISIEPEIPVVESTPFSKPTFSYKNVTIDTDFKLGNDQSVALQTLVDFVKVGNPSHSQQNVITLEGAAGTGKTAIIGYLQKYFGRNKSFAFLAPTHAATAELAFATVKSGNIYLPSTIQSAITYNKMKDSYVFTKKIMNKIGMYSPVIVVDEASMIDGYDITNLIQAVEDVGGRLVLMGDEKQIPKVSQSSASTKPLSPAFTDFRKVTLNKVFRQSEGSLLDLLTAMRNQTEFKLFKVPNSESIKFLDRRGYNEELIKDVKSNPESTVVISYTNSSVKDTNSSIRKLLGRTGETVVGDIVVGYLGYASKQIEKGDIANSINYTITDIVEDGSVRQIHVKSSKVFL